jgi:hypothetical protein
VDFPDPETPITTSTGVTVAGVDRLDVTSGVTADAVAGAGGGFDRR